MVILSAWIVATCYAFWWFEFKYITRFDNYLATFSGKELRSVAVSKLTDKLATVAYFVEPNCPCSPFAISHLESLQMEWSDSALFLDGFDLTHSFTPPVTPAVAIWDSSGTLTYFGPFSGGATCGSGDDYVSIVIEELKRGINLNWINQDAVGCFCPPKAQ